MPHPHKAELITRATQIARVDPQNEQLTGSQSCGLMQTDILEDWSHVSQLNRLRVKQKTTQP